jgi:hypothetical protein
MRRLATSKILVHHSVMPQGLGKTAAMSQILSTHKAAGLAYDGQIAYHHVIGHNWESFGRDINSVGYHAGHWWTNLTSVAVCMMGDFRFDKLNAYQTDRLRNRLQYWSDVYRLNRSNVYLHRDFASTVCPGTNITPSLITTIYNLPRPGGKKRTPLPPQKR